MTAPGSAGVYGILDHGVAAADVEFEQVYQAARTLTRRSGAVAPPPATTINVAVVDSGVYSAGDDFFGPRVVASGDAQRGLGTVALTRGTPATEGQHGAHVASIASSGTSMIRIIDAQVGSTQEGGSVQVAAWTTAFKWAIAQGARIVNVSIVCPWREPAISGIVNSNTGVLFLATSGNADSEFSEAYLAENGLKGGNVMLVGGCARNGNREAQRGFGAGIDVFVPSVQVPGRIAKRYAQEIYFKRDRIERDRQDRRLDPDRERVKNLEAKVRDNPDDANVARSLDRERKRLASGVDKLPPLPASAAVYPLNALALKIADSGVSFGIPMVANVAAKMMLIMPNITPREVIAIMRRTALGCAVGRVMDPAACYAAALNMRREWALRI